MSRLRNFVNIRLEKQVSNGHASKNILLNTAIIIIGDLANYNVNAAFSFRDGSNKFYYWNRVVVVAGK